MTDQEQRRQVLTEIEKHIIEIRRLANSIELLTDAEHRRQVEVAFGLLSVDWKHHNQSKPAGTETVPVEDLAKRLAAERQRQIDDDDELRRRKLR